MRTIEERVFDLLNDSNTNWETEMRPMMIASDNGYTETEFKAHVRKFDNKVFQTFKSYSPLQNHEMAEIVLRAADKIGLTTAKGGSLNEGAKVYYQVVLPEERVNEHEIKRNITALNSHDGSTAVGLGFSNTVVVCQNTFYRAMKDLKKVRHSSTMMARVDALAKDIEVAIVGEKKVISNFKRMAEVPATSEMILAVVDKLFPIKRTADRSTRMENEIKSMLQGMNKEFNEKGKTVWGIFNGVTYYTNHLAKNEKSMDYLMAGTGQKKNAIAYDEMMRWMDERTHELVIA